MNTYDAVTFALRQSLSTPEIVTKIQDSPDGSILFFAHSFTVTMWDMQTGGLIHTFTMKSKINDIAVSTTHIACGLSDGSVTIWDIHTKEEGKGFENDQPVETIYWLPSQELAVVTQNSLSICDYTLGETLGRFSVPGQVWGVVYLEGKNEYLVGTSQPTSRVGQEESFFIRCKQPKLQPRELKLLRWRFKNLGVSPAHSGQLLSPTLVGKEIVCITPPNGVQLFNTSSYKWTNSPPLLGAAIFVAESLNRNLVVQTKDSVQIFSQNVLTRGKAHNGAPSSHVYPLGENYIICILQPTRHINLLKLETLQRLRPDASSSLIRSQLANQMTSAHGLVGEFGVSVVLRAWVSGTPLPEWTEAAEDALFSGWSPKCTLAARVHSSPQWGLCVRHVKDRTILAVLPLEDDVGAGEVYDITFESETRFSLKISGPEQHIQIPYDITALPSGNYPHTITKGEPVPLSEPRATPPYTLDMNCEWVLDTKSRKVCWISPGDIRRGHGGHFWVGPSLVMVGDDGVVRKLTFKDPDS